MCFFWMSALSWLHGSIHLSSNLGNSRFKVEEYQKTDLVAVKMVATAVDSQRGISSQSRQTHELFMIVQFLIVLHAVVLPTNAVVRSGEYNGDIINKVFCQGEQLKIRCPNSSYALSIHGGSYGRTQPGEIVCPYEGSENDFYYNCGENDITEKLIQICKRKKKCIFEVGKAVFGDPCRGRAYLTVIYSCVKKKRKKNKNKTVKTLPTTNTLPGNISTTLKTNLTTAFTSLPTEYGWNSSANTTLINSHVPNILSATGDDSTGILISIIVWFIFMKSNSRSFLTVFTITLGSATFCFLVIFGLLLLRKRFKEKRREKNRLDNSEAQKLNTMTSSNCDVKKKTEVDTLSNTFPAPAPALPPPPDDMMYPSPGPDMINSSRPPPPPVQRGCSLDDISKIGQDARKHVPVKRSISLRTRPPDYYPKEFNFDKLPNIDNAGDIQAVIIQRNNGSTMYMNPMYENGHMREVAC